MNNRMQPDATSPYFVFQKRGLFCLWIVIIIYVALSEAEIFPTSFLGKSAETKYFSDIISIITAIGGSFLAYSLPSWKRVAAIFRAAYDSTEQEKASKMDKSAIIPFMPRNATQHILLLQYLFYRHIAL